MSKKIEELEARIQELEKDLDDSLRVIVGTINIFGIDVRDVEHKLEITQVVKAMKNLAFDAVIPGRMSALKRKFSFLKDMEPLARKYEVRGAEIQQEMNLNS